MLGTLPTHHVSNVDIVCFDVEDGNGGGGDGEVQATASLACLSSCLFLYVCILVVCCLLDDGGGSCDLVVVGVAVVVGVNVSSRGEISSRFVKFFRGLRTAPCHGGSI